jgi:carbamoyltransferase
MSVNWCVVGLTPFTTSTGIPHIDGSACAITASEIVAVAEERLSREKHAGGSELSLRSVLDAVGRTPRDVTGYFLSTCGEASAGVPAQRSLGGHLHASLSDLGVDATRVHWVPSHHASHAAAASVLLNGERGLVLVIDDAGSAEPGAGASFERASAFLANGNGADGELRLVARVSSGAPGGLGSLYRAATAVLGFDGYRDCGKTTALAAYGTADARALQLLHPNDPSRMAVGAEDVLRTVLAERGSQPLAPGWQWRDGHATVAAFAQEAIEQGVRHWVKRALDAVARLGHPCRRVVICGGVALNCRAMGRLVEWRVADEVQVFHAPSDTGQGLGNAIFGARRLGLVPPASATSSPYLGPQYSSERIVSAVRSLTSELDIVQLREPVEQRIVHELGNGATVGIFDGRSEYGPRALGHRSILSDPRWSSARDVLNRVKGREPFRPFGLSLLEGDATRATGTRLKSPAMLLAVRLTEAAADSMPGAVHVDGTTRIHTVRNDASLLASILQRWRHAAGVPGLINTSFNLAGAPIVETPEEAISVFRAMNLDLLALRPPSGPPILLRRKTGPSGGMPT